MLARLMRIVLRGEHETSFLPFSPRGPRFLLSRYVESSSIDFVIPARLKVIEASCEVVEVDHASSAFLVGPDEVSITVGLLDGHEPEGHKAEDDSILWALGEQRHLG
jgi:hypothetical protein